MKIELDLSLPELGVLSMVLNGVPVIYMGEDYHIKDIQKKLAAAIKEGSRQN